MIVKPSLARFEVALFEVLWMLPTDLTSLVSTQLLTHRPLKLVCFVPLFIRAPALASVLKVPC